MPKTTTWGKYRHFVPFRLWLPASTQLTLKMRKCLHNILSNTLEPSKVFEAETRGNVSVLKINPGYFTLETQFRLKAITWPPRVHRRDDGNELRNIVIYQEPAETKQAGDRTWGKDKNQSFLLKLGAHRLFLHQTTQQGGVSSADKNTSLLTAGCWKVTFSNRFFIQLRWVKWMRSHYFLVWIYN